MNLDTQLKVQAFVDGELPASEAARIEELIAKDAEARRLAGALRGARDMVRENEPQRVVPETREFYWSKIAREMERAEAGEVTPSRSPWAASLWRWLAPVGGLAALIALLVVFGSRPGVELALTEVQVASPDMGAMTFSDQEAGVTMVWIYDRTTEPFTEAAQADILPPQ